MDLGTDDNIANEPLETIQEILRCRECDNSINVKMIIEMAGSRQGDNYMSLVKRLVVSGTHNKNQNENGKNFVIFFLGKVRVREIMRSLGHFMQWGNLVVIADWRCLRT